MSGTKYKANSRNHVPWGVSCTSPDNGIVFRLTGIDLCLKCQESEIIRAKAPLPQVDPCNSEYVADMPTPRQRHLGPASIQRPEVFGLYPSI